jgi:hypothetical protein
MCNRLVRQLPIIIRISDKFFIWIIWVCCDEHTFLETNKSKIKTVVMKKFCTLFWMLMVLHIALFAQPANDDCANAITLTPAAGNIPVLTEGTTAAATQSLAPCSGTTANDVWYRFVATKTAHRVVAQQNGMGSPPIVQVFSGTCGELTSIQCFSGFPAGGLVTGLTIGNTYLVRIYAATNVAAGAFRVAITSRPQNDECVDAFALTPAAVNAGPNYIPASSIDATLSEVACSGSQVSDDDVWFKFTATTNAHRINIRGFFQNASMVEVYSGTCGAKTQLNICGDFSNGSSPGFVNFGGLTPGTEYFFRVFSVFATSASASNFDVAVTSFNAPTNDECAGAIAIPVGGATCQNPFEGTLTNATSSKVALCGITNAPNHLYRDVWFKFVATAKAHFISTNLLSFRDLTIFSGACNSLVPIGCVPGTGSVDGIAIGSLTIGQTYFIRMGSSNSNVNDFNICVTTPIFDENDDCASASTITSSGTTDCNRVFGNTANASQSGASNCISIEVPANDQWYKFTADQTQYRLRLASAENVQARMEVFAGSCATLAAVTGGACTTPTSGVDTVREIKLTGLTQGETYFIRIVGAKVSAGAYNLCLKDIVPPVNDDCPGAKELTVGTSISSMPAFTTTNMLDVSQSLPGCAGTAEDDLWYTFEATGASVGVYTSFVTNDQVLQVFTGPCDNLQSIACIQQPHLNARASFDLLNLTPGTRYRMRLYTVANFIWSSSFSQSILVFNKTLPDNNACLNAIVLNPAANNQCNATSATTVDATNTRAACNNVNSRDVWFKFEATATTHFLQVWGFLFSPRIELLQGNCESLSSITCFNDNTSATTSQNSPRITRRELSGLTPGNTYWLKISANESGFERDGIFNICLTTPNVPANDECSGAISIPVCTGPECEAKGLFTTNRATQSRPNCSGGNPANDVWFKFSTDKEVMIVIDNLNRQVRQEVFTGTCDNLTPVANTCTNFHIQTLAKPTGMTEYFLRVYSNESTANGSLEFSLKVFEVQDIKLNSTIDTACVVTNLTTNPSFEFASNCPSGFIGSAAAGSSIGSLTGWTFPTPGTSDFFNACATSSTNSVHIPGNLCFGSQEPRSGRGYVGLFALTSSTYKEYIQGQLATPMVPGKKYLVSFYVSLAEFSNTAVDKIGAFFRTSALIANSSSTIIATPHVESTAGSAIKDKTKWVNISGIFEPTEAYTHVIIGNFRTNNNLTIESLEDISGGVTGGTHPGCSSPGINSYYFIDDVFVGEIDETASAACGTLPVTWLSFTATPKQADAQLEWKTTNENNCKSYEVERSRDGSIFTRIGEADCRNQPTPQMYQYTDLNPGKGTFYYRLKQVDTDGKFEYSVVRKVSFGEDANIKVYPNPVSDLLQIINVPVNSEIRLYDASGRLVMQTRSAQTFNQLKVGHLTAGIYQLSITTITGERVIEKVQIMR